MTAKSMVEGLPIGDGERRAKARRKRVWTVLGVLFAVGFVSGLSLSMAEGKDAGVLEGPIPGWVAILLSGVWLAAMIGGTLWYKKAVDELEVLNNVWAMAVAGSVIMIGYPVWWLLWRGRIAAEPDAHIMFGVLYFVMMAAYLWKKFR